MDMVGSETHLVAICNNCGAPQPLTLSSPLGACEHCGNEEPVAPGLRDRLGKMRARLAKRDQSPRQLSGLVLLEGDSLHGAAAITLVVCWLLFGSLALYLSLSHDVPFVEFVTSGEPPEQWWLLWAFALGLALSVALLEFSVVLVRGLSAEALPNPPISHGASPRCRCCAAELEPGTALRRCGSCQTDNLVLGNHYRRVEKTLDLALGTLEKQFDRNLKARINFGGKIAMVGGVAPFFLLFIGPAIGLLTPGKPFLWVLPGIVVLLAIALAVLARARRLPVEALELMSIGDKVGLGSPVDTKRRVCAQLMLESGPVSLLGKTAETADFAVSTHRQDGTYQVVVCRVKPGTHSISEQQRSERIHTDLWNKTKGGAPSVQRVYTLTTDDGWCIFQGQEATSYLDGVVCDKPPRIWRY